MLEPERLEKRQGGTLRFDAGSGVTTNLGAEPASRSGAKKMPSEDYTAWQLIWTVGVAGFCESADAP